MVPAVTAVLLLIAAFAPLAGVMAAQTLETVIIKDPDAPEIFQSVEEDIKQKRLTPQQRNVEGCDRFGETRAIYADKAGAIRKYTLTAGAEDSVLTVNHYYDGAGKLRYVRVVGGAVNGTYLYQRIYFDESGARIRDDRNIVKGSGYPFPPISDENGLLSRDPRQAYDRGCEKQ